VNISRVEDSESADLQLKIEDYYSDYGLWLAFYSAL